MERTFFPQGRFPQCYCFERALVLPVSGGEPQDESFCGSFAFTGRTNDKIPVIFLGNRSRNRRLDAAMGSG